jgi:hypothetical protein
MKCKRDGETKCRRQAGAASRAWGVLGDKQAAIRGLAASALNRDYWLGIMLNHPANNWLRAEPGFQEVYQAVFGSSVR